MLAIRRNFPKAFLCILDPSVADDPRFRLTCFDAGFNMVSYETASIIKTIQECVMYILANPQHSHSTRYSCPYCNLENLTEDMMWYHCPAFHINSPNNARISHCPICGLNLRDTRIPFQVSQLKQRSSMISNSNT